MPACARAVRWKFAVAFHMVYLRSLVNLRPNQDERTCSLSVNVFPGRCSLFYSFQGAFPVKLIANTTSLEHLRTMAGSVVYCMQNVDIGLAPLVICPVCYSYRRSRPSAIVTLILLDSLCRPCSSLTAKQSGPWHCDLGIHCKN